MTSVYSIQEVKSSLRAPALAKLTVAVLVILFAGLALTVVFKYPAPDFIGASSIQSSGNPNVRVWVNTNSGVYHCPNTRWYGKTKSGKYMTQKEAQSKGYRPAYGSVCG